MNFLYLQATRDLLEFCEKFETARDDNSVRDAANELAGLVLGVLRLPKRRDSDEVLRNALEKQELLTELLKTATNNVGPPAAAHRILPFSDEDRKISRESFLEATEVFFTALPEIFSRVPEPRLTTATPPSPVKKNKPAEYLSNLATYPLPKNFDTLPIETFSEGRAGSTSAKILEEKLENAKGVESCKVLVHGAGYLKLKILPRTFPIEKINGTIFEVYGSSFKLARDGSFVEGQTEKFEDWKATSPTLAGEMSRAADEVDEARKNLSTFFLRVRLETKEVVEENPIFSPPARQTKSLGEDFVVDLLFFICVGVVGFFYGAAPWISVVAHLFFSLVGAVTAFVRAPRFASNRVAWTAGASTATFLTDTCALSQLFSAAFEETAAKQRGLLYGTEDPEENPIFFGAVSSALLIAIVAAAFRVHKIRYEASRCLSQAATGACFLGTLVHAGWLYDFGADGYAAFDFRNLLEICLVLACGAEIGRLAWRGAATTKKIDCTSSSKEREWMTNRTDGWSVFAYVLTFVYYVLFVNAAAEFVSGAVAIHLLGQEYSANSEKFQAFFIASTLFFSRVVVSMTIATDLTAEETKRKEEIASRESVFQTVVRGVALQASMAVLPTLCAIVVAFDEKKKSAFAEFTLVAFFYSTLSFLRFWVLATAVSKKTATIVGAVGILLLDVGFIVLLLLDTFLTNIFISNNFTRVTLIAVTATSAIVSALTIIA